MVFEHLRNGQHLYTGRSRIGKLLGFFHCLSTFEKIIMWMSQTPSVELIAKPIAAFPLCGYELMRCNPRPWAAKRLAHRKTHLVTKARIHRNHKESISGLCWSWWVNEHWMIILPKWRATRWGLISNQISICWIGLSKSELDGCDECLHWVFILHWRCWSCRCFMTSYIAVHGTMTQHETLMWSQYTQLFSYPSYDHIDAPWCARNAAPINFLQLHDRLWANKNHLLRWKITVFQVL